MITVNVTVTPLYAGERYVHHDHDRAPAARMRQKTRLRPRLAAYRTRAGPLAGYNAITVTEQLPADNRYILAALTEVDEAAADEVAPAVPAAAARRGRRARSSSRTSRSATVPGERRH
jgi:hypothetical protein